MRFYRVGLAVRAICLPVMILLAPVPCAAAETAPANLSAGQIDALVAPVALYPDQLLAKVMIASTYPLEVVEADRWLEKHKDLKGKALDEALGKLGWDDSVKSLVHTPDVLKMMSDELDWTQKLGNAFLAQQEDVMASVQRLRKQAQASGSLKSTNEQKVEVSDQAIAIEPTQPDVVYVPYYNPQVVYGTWAYPAYPPRYWPPPPGYAYGTSIAAGIGFATGVAISVAFWNNAFDWRRGNVYVNHHVTINNYNSFRRTNINRTNWQHNPAHRRGVNYSNKQLRQKYGKGTLPGANARRDFRGFNNNARGTRSNANTRAARGGANTRATRGNTGTRVTRGNANTRATRGNTGTRVTRGPGSSRPSGSAANRKGTSGARRSVAQNQRGGAFNGAGNGRATRQYSARGRASMSGQYRGGRGGGRRR